MAKSLINAAQLIEDAPLSNFVNERYAGWEQELGQAFYQVSTVWRAYPS